MEDISHGLETRPIPCEPCENSPQHPLPDKFQYVRRSIPGAGCPRQLFEEQLCGCDCVGSCDPDTCCCLTRFGPSYHPQSRQLTPEAVVSSSLQPVLECNSQCSCDETCSNRLVQHGPRASLKVAPAGPRGFGLFACEDIKQLTFVCEYAGEVIGPPEARRRMEGRDGGMNYLIVLREHYHTGTVLTCVDPEHVGNVGRFANHSCDPSLLMVPVRVDNSVPKLALFARRSISAGEELTFDYSGESVLNRASSSSRFAGTEQKHGDEVDTALLAQCRKEIVVKADKTEAITETDCNTNLKRGSRNNIRQKEVSVSGVADSNVSNAESVDSEIYDECQKCSNSEDVSCKCGRDHGSVSQLSVTDVTTGKKRKHSHSRDREDSSDRNLASDKDLVKKPLADSEKGMHQTTLKVCLCGTSQCKGYLPFDGLILKT